MTEFLIFFVWLVIMILIAVSFYIRGRRVEKLFEDLDLSEVKFREKRASGSSQKSFFTKIGGASGLLDAIVTETELCIKGVCPPISLIASKYDLVRRVRLTDIEQISKEGSRIELSFNDKSHNMVLRLEEPDDLVKVINGLRS